MGKANFERISRNIVKEYLELSTSNISDALDSLKIKGGCERIEPVTEGCKMAGPAFTVKYLPISSEGGTVGDYVDEAKPGDVIVIDNAGRTYCTVWGDLLTVAAKKMGLAGTVIDGVCRDIPAIRKLSYPLFSRGRFMMTGKDRVEAVGTNIPIAISNVQVVPGDLVVGDDSGVVVVPKKNVDTVLKNAREISKKEQSIEKCVTEGLTLAEARERYGYHKLQR